MVSTAQSLTERDAACLWHPYRQTKLNPQSLPFVKGKDAFLFTAEGIPYLDAISSWWVNLHGHCHPYIAKSIAHQARELEHVIFSDFTHSPAIELAERLLIIFGNNMKKVFFSDNGSTAVEAALKIVIQYWHNQQLGNEKKRLIAFKGAFHGETFGAMSASGKNPLNHPFWPYLFDVDLIDPPFKGYEEASIEQLKNLLEKRSAAAFIFEPVVQGVFGMRTHNPKGLDSLITLCREHGVLTIADEVMTGFGRTGPLFASHFLNNGPDIVCLSKAITGGFLPLGATLCREFVHHRFVSDSLSQSLLHGHSYTGNPIACAAAKANLDLLEHDDCSKQRKKSREAIAIFVYI